MSYVINGGTSGGGGGGSAPAGTGIVSVTDGEYDTPTTLASRLAAIGGATTTDVSNAINILDAKQAVYAVEALVNVVPTGVKTVGGVVPPDGSRVLLTAQTDPTQNRLYTTNNAGGWFATSDSNSPEVQLEAGSRVFCQAGDNAGQVYVLRTTGVITLLTALDWQTLVPAPGTIVQVGASSLIGSDPAGTAIISDGAGAVQPTSTDVSAMLAAADAAAARTVIGLGTLATLDIETLFPRAPLQTALHRHRLDEASGTLADGGSGAIAATLAGSSWSRGVAGPYRGRLGILRTGTTRTDAVQVTGTTIPAAGFSFAVTIISTTRGAPSVYGPLACVSNGGGSGAYNYLCLTHQTGAVYVITGKTATQTGGTPYAITDWSRAMRIVVTYVSATKTQVLYVNGVLRVSEILASAALADCTSLSLLGGAPTGSNPAAAGDGSCPFTLSDSQVWNRALSAAEVAADWSDLAGSLI